MIAPSMRGTMAVHLLINTLIIISLLLNELSALRHHCLKPPPHLIPLLPVFFSFERKRFSHFTFFFHPFVCSARLFLLTLMGRLLRMLMARHFHNTSTN